MLKNDMQVKAAKIPAGKKTHKETAGDGLYLLIKSGGKYWKFDYMVDHVRRYASLGVYPNVSLKDAKIALGALKEQIKQGIDPNVKKQTDKLVRKQAQEKSAIDANTFEIVARQWHNTRKNGWSDKHAKTILSRFEKYVIPSIGAIPITQLTKVQVSDTIIKISERGTIETAKRIGQIIRQVLDYACDRGLIDSIPMGKLNNLLPERTPVPMPALSDPDRIGELLMLSKLYQGEYVVHCALRLLPYLGLRAGEYRKAHWSEFDLDNALWTIPAKHRKLTKTKKADPNNILEVPLSTQAVAILKELYEHTGNGTHIFPSRYGDTGSMSENTINKAIRRMGFGGEMVGHGWRSVLSTSLNEKGYNPDAIERQLAHVGTNAVRGAYNRGEYWEERVQMMQDYADYLDGLREEAEKKIDG